MLCCLWEYYEAFVKFPGLERSSEQEGALRSLGCGESFPGALAVAAHPVELQLSVMDRTACVAPRASPYRTARVQNLRVLG